MDSSERRNLVKKYLYESSEPVKGQKLAEIFSVTRQIIVKDIALIRAEGENIVSTPKGYIIIRKDGKSIKRVVAVNHSAEQMKDELMTIVRYGGTIEDVIVEHALYGEIRGMLMIRTLHDVDSFYEKYKMYTDEPLSALTKGVHLHTITCDSRDTADRIISELDRKGYLIKDYK